jgi:signal transduction histidine kinase
MLPPAGPSDPPAQTDTGDAVAAAVDRLQTRTDALQQELERTERLATLGVLAGAVAHELNNVLTPAMNYTQMALGDAADEALKRKALERANDAVRRASQIVSGMLGLARPSSDIAEAEVGVALDRAVEYIARPLAKDGIELVRDIAPDVVAAMPPIDLEQVLLNLLMNARDAMAPKPGTIAVSAAAYHRAALPQAIRTMLAERSTDGPDGGGDEASADRAHGRHVATRWVLVRVVDTGPGIPASVRERLFEPLVSDKGAAGVQGTGLGLTICKRLVERSGGVIRCSSGPAVGTAFAIVLPAAGLDGR